MKVALHRETTAQRLAYDVIRGTIEYKAVGGRSVSVVGSTYSLTGSQVVPCARAATPAAVGNVFKGMLPDPQRSRFMADVWEVQPAAVLAAGKFVGDGKRLDPNVTAARDLIFLVPRHRSFQLLRLRAQLFAIPASMQLSQREEPTYERLAGGNVFGFWHVDDDSWFRDLVYGRERWVVLRYELTGGRPTSATPDLRVLARFPNPTWGRDRPSKARTLRLFADGVQPSDASEPFAGAELALADVDPNARDSQPPACRRKP